jgi:hypothetical protein
MTALRAADDDEQLLENLRELIAALERRVPHIERVGEIDIARDAASLMEKALARVATLSRRQRARRVPRG